MAANVWEQAAVGTAKGRGEGATRMRGSRLGRGGIEGGACARACARVRWAAHTLVVCAALAGVVYAAAVDYAALRTAMVQRLRKSGISNQRVLDAMGRVPREAFVVEEHRDTAYDEVEVPVGYGEVLLPPQTAAVMLQALDPPAKGKCLEVGTGCGYHTALLAEVNGSVVTLDSRRKLAEAAKTRLRTLGYTKVEARICDGAKGWPEKGLFDAILVTYAVQELPEALVDQLADGGRMVVPIGTYPDQTLIRVQRVKDRLKSETVCTSNIPALSPERKTGGGGRNRRGERGG